MLDKTSEAVFKWGETQQKMKATQADLNMKTQAMSIEDQAIADPDYNGLSSKLLEADKAFDASTRGLQDPESLAMIRYQKEALKIKLTGIYRKKQIENHQVNVMKENDIQVQNPTEKSMEIIKANLENNKEFFDAKDLYNLEKKYNDDLGKNRINKDLYSAKTPEQVDQVTQDITNGFYEKGGVTIDSTDKKNFLEIADRVKTKIEKKNKELIEDSELVSALETSSKLVDNTLTQEEIQMKVNDGILDPEIAGALEMARYSQKWDEFASPENIKKIGMSAKYLIGVVDRMENFNPKEAKKVIKESLDSYNKTPKTVNENDLAFIFKAIENKRGSGNDPIWGKLWSAIRWMGGVSAADQAVQIFTNTWNWKDDPMEAAQVASEAASIQQAKNKFEKGKRYKWGEYIGMNPQTGKHLFKE